ncbi:MAG: hypothetical protein KAJ79_08765 [Candidatus Omnitrophica bacterium]|nr:hypothetical protein [Candidatus Omnitrophota bacterium]
MWQNIRAGICRGFKIIGDAAVLLLATFFRDCDLGYEALEILFFLETNDLFFSFVTSRVNI